MSRIVRERGSVGRRIWRRRSRRRSAGIEGADPELPPFSAPADSEEAARETTAEGTRARGGFFSALKTKLFGGKKGGAGPVEASTAGGEARGTSSIDEKGGGEGGDAPVARSRGPAPAVATDAVGEVLSVPRGAARLDAFERALLQTTPGGAMHKDLALAFHRELSTLTEQAGVDLSLLEDRVDACAQALLAAGEEERAGSLFLRMGARHRAVDVFVKAGAVEALEETYAHIHWEEGGAKQDARLAFERFEALFAVGMREAALLSLERAVKLWGDNPVFVEVYQSFLARIGPPHRKLFRSGKHELLLVSKWPVVIGRGEEAAVRLASPLLSRAHVQIVLEGGVARVRDLDSRGGTRVDDAPLSGSAPLVERGAIDMGGVVVRYERRADAVVLTPALHPERFTWAVVGHTGALPDFEGAPTTNVVRIDAHGRSALLRGGVLNDERISRDTLLLEGDRIGPWTVSRA